MITTASRGQRAVALAIAAGLTAVRPRRLCRAAPQRRRAPTAPRCAPEDIQLIGQVRNETNPYEKAWLDGGDAFAESVGLEQTRLTYDGESPKQQEQLRQALSTGNPECMVLNVLPNGDSDTTPIVKEADAAGAYLVTHWNKPADLNPWDGYDTWISHITFNGVDSGHADRRGDVRGDGRRGRHHRAAGHPRHERREGPVRRAAGRRSPRTPA